MRRMLEVVLAALALCVILNIPEERTQAGETLKVPDTYSTIQAAIDAALNGDTVLVADGTYTGSGNKDLDFDGKAITVKSEKGPNNCIIDCQDDGRGFYFHNDETSSSVVEGFTIKNGDTGIYYGAGIYCYDGACPTIKNCVFEDNSTRRGGAIACKKNSSATISNCVMKNNWALYGGGIWLYDDSDATIKDCVITNNTADNNGGGIQSYDSNPTITNCLIANNEAISPGVGGGVYFYEGSVGTLTNCTIANNEGRYGGGLSAKDQGTTMTLNNTIIWGNHASTYGHQIRAYGYGAVVLNYCDYANGDNDVNTSSQGTVTPSNCTNSDPSFTDSGSYGVEGDGDFHIQAGSPCIDAGDNNVTSGDYDWDGNARILDGDKDETDTVDIGFYEGHPDWSPNAVVSDAPQLNLIAPVPEGFTDAGSFFGYSDVNDTLYFFEKSANGWESPVTVDDNIPNIIQIAVADVTGNDLPDLYALAPADAKIYWYENAGNGIFYQQEVASQCQNNSKCITPVGEDLLVVEWSSEDPIGLVSVWENSGGETITFTKKLLLSGEFCRGINLLASGDVTSDDRVDAVAANSITHEVYYLENMAEGDSLRLIPRIVTYDAPEGLKAMTVLESDGSSFADIGMIVEASPARFTIYQNDGGCSFVETGESLGVVHVSAISPIELSADGNVDFMALDVNRTRISWMENRFDASPQPEDADIVCVASTIEPTYICASSEKAFSVEVRNISHIESVTLGTSTLLRFGGPSGYESFLSAEVTVSTESVEKLEFNSATIPQLDAGEYEVTIEFRGSGGYNQDYPVKDKIHISPATLSVTPSNSPVVVRGQCDFEDVEVESYGVLLAEGSDIKVKNLTIKYRGKFKKAEYTTWMPITSDLLIGAQEIIVKSEGAISGNCRIETEKLVIESGGEIEANGIGYTDRALTGCGGNSEDGGGGGGGGFTWTGEDNDGKPGDGPGGSGTGGAGGPDTDFSLYSNSKGKFGGNGAKGAAPGGRGGGFLHIKVKKPDNSYGQFIHSGTISATGLAGKTSSTCLAGGGGGSGGAVIVDALIDPLSVGGKFLVSPGKGGAGTYKGGDGGKGYMSLPEEGDGPPPIEDPPGSGEFFIPRIVNVEWVAIDSPLDENENDGGGKRIYPGKQTPSDTTDRKKVKIRATIDPPVQNIGVYFKVFDVDDPSAGDSLVDDEDESTDNRGSWSQVASSSVNTDSSGHAEIVFSVSMQPGDNFRAVATLHASHMNGLYAKQDDGTLARIFDGSNNPLSTDYVKVTADILTVWRKLHTEVDSMGEASGTQITGTITAVVDNGDGTSTVTTNQNLDDSADRFEDGEMVNAERLWSVVSNTTGNNFQITVSNIDTTTPSLGGFNVVDDDAAWDGFDVPEPNTDVLQDLYKPAYITVVFDGGGDPDNNEGDLNFDANIQNITEEINQLTLGRDSSNTEEFWTIYMQGAFQGPIEKDSDPDSEASALEGIALLSGILIYHETIRDWAVQWGDDPEEEEGLIVGHETGHQFNLSEHKEGTIMGLYNQPALFDDEQLDTIRDQTKPRSY